ncbi:MAG: flavin reductase family protein [Polyangiaceae bacterium]|nr:flavin reductase family protein [Polyangiaceae bacterium]
MPVTPTEFKAAMGRFAAGVTVVTTMDATGKAWGLTVTAFSSVSLEPPLCLACIDRRAASLEVFRASRKLGVNMLAADQQELSARFASKLEDKFAGVAWAPGPVTGSPLLEGVVASLECRIVDFLGGGDHDILIASVETVTTRDALPLVYFQGRYGDVAPRG